ncbi:LysE family transporter, partial [Salmonella enterica subsp. enterica serovar Kentucky]|nr:LysE family transporter [Salmonella enterica subsp. enterica serovar Kentucky]
GAIFIVLVPGPNTLFVLKNSVGRGVKGGYLAACGVFIGDAIFWFLATDLTLNKGTLTLDDMVGQSSMLALTGSGTLDLVKQSCDTQF